MLTGAPPYQDDDLRKLCLMHVQAPIPAVESPHGPLPPKLADVITTCLQKSPQARFPGMRAMLAALDEVERVTDRRGWRRWLSYHERRPLIVCVDDDDAMLASVSRALRREPGFEVRTTLDAARGARLDRRASRSRCSSPTTRCPR